MARLYSKRKETVAELTPEPSNEAAVARRTPSSRKEGRKGSPEPESLQQALLGLDAQTRALSERVDCLLRERMDDATRLRNVEQQLARLAAQSPRNFPYTASWMPPVKRVMRAVRRKTFHFAPQPLHHVALVQGARGRFVCTGHDPQVSLQPAKKRFPRGWTRIHFHFGAESSGGLGVQLYFDSGDGFSEAHSSRLELTTTQGSTMQIVQYIPPGLRGLRLDPLVSGEGTFCIEHVTIQEITKHEALAALGMAALRERKLSRRQLVDAGQAILVRLRAEGVSGTLEHLRRRGGRLKDYAVWAETFATLTEGDRTAMRARIAEFEFKPTISVIMPVYNVTETYLRKAIASVQGQIYTNWELCIADDCSTSPKLAEVLRSYAKLDPRIKVTFRKSNGHISAASNSALALATGEFVALLDHDDELTEHALFCVLDVINRHPDAGLIYSDEDKLTSKGALADPYFKPDWNYDLLLSQNYISHLGVYRKTLLSDVGGFREGYEGSQDYDLVLRVIEQLPPNKIHHIPHVLYHWRALPNSTATNADVKPYAHTAAERALRSHLQRMQTPATVAPAPGPGLYRVRYELPAHSPRVSLVIPTRDREGLLRQCVESILKKTEYRNFEITIVDNQSKELSALRYLKTLRSRPQVRVMTYDRPFNFSAMNNLAVAACQADVVGLLNNDLEVIDPEWLHEMLSHALRPAVGAVGAKLYFPDRTIQHGGVVLGMGGIAAHAWKHLPRNSEGYFGRAKVIQSFSAVTAACLLVRRDLYTQIGGLDEAFEVAYNDVDFCLRLAREGFSNVWTPFAQLIHHESASRGSDLVPDKIERFNREMALMRQRWGAMLDNDAAYNPNLTLHAPDFSLAFPPRVRQPWRA